MRTIGLIAMLALGLMAFKCEGQKAAFDSDASAFCKTNYVDRDSCNVDSRCDWSDSKNRCAEK